MGIVIQSDGKSIIYDYDEAGNIVSKISFENGHLDDDGDGLNNATEVANGTDPNNGDTDSDSMPDGWEVTYGLDPLSNDANGDADYDDVSNYDEYLAGTHPNQIQSDLVLANKTINLGMVKEYRATNSITSGPAYIVQSGAVVTFKAENTINLKPGFSANGGSDLSATIE
ncbi:MAG: hypothetical protein GY928_37895 [Colwellia sp.]|nr:hypothetical protein [Colwellia sp.]